MTQCPPGSHGVPRIPPQVGEVVTGVVVLGGAVVVGGAVVGNQVEQRNRQGGTAYQIGVRLDNGGYQTYTQESIGDLNIGNRVRVDNGRVYRY